MTTDASAGTTTSALLSSSERKHRAILAAAQDVFLSGGYLGTNMDEIATRSGVSKQTVYKHFGSKEALFVELVTSMTGEAGNRVHDDVETIGDDQDVADFLQAYAERQLRIVLSPGLMQLRRLVIGEVTRFPELARTLYERGPQRAVAELGRTFEDLAARGLLQFDHASVAASDFNWLVMGEPINATMMLGDNAIPSKGAISSHAERATRVFLAAYGCR